jgi:hypothetical protein
MQSSFPLKIPTTAHQRHALVHDGLADPEVVLDPALDAGRLGEGVGFDAGALVKSDPTLRTHYQVRD